MPLVHEVFKALGDPVRIRIVEMLARNGETCVCRIVPELGMTQPAVSHHLAILKRAGVVIPRREGNWIYYSLSESTLYRVAAGFIESLITESEAVSRKPSKCK